MIQHLDLTYHMEQCKESMQAERRILQDKSTLICTRLKNFNPDVSIALCFGNGHRT